MPRAADWQVKEPKKIQAKLWKRKTQNITSSKTQNIPKCFSWPIFCISAMIFLVKSKSLHKCESFPPLSPAHPMTLRDQLRHVGNGKMSSPVKNSSTSPKIEGTVNPTKKTERKNVLKPFDVCSWKTSLWFLREFCDALPTHSVIDWQKKLDSTSVLNLTRPAGGLPNELFVSSWGQIAPNSEGFCYLWWWKKPYQHHLGKMRATTPLVFSMLFTKNAALQSSVWMSNCTKKFPEYSGWFLISRAAVSLLEGFKIQELCILSTCGKIKFIQK